MGYLRGTSKPTNTTYHSRYPIKKTLGQEVAALKRKVSKNKAAPYSFRQVLQFDAPTVAGAYVLHTINLTDRFVTSSTYHDNVTGDWFINKSLNLKMTLVGDLLRYRVIVYKPRRVGTSFAPGENAAGYVSHPDAAAFNVMRDVYSAPIEADSPRSISLRIPLRDMKTCFDTDTNLIEQGEIKVALLYQSNELSGATIVTTIGTMLTVCDK